MVVTVTVRYARQPEKFLVSVPAATRERLLRVLAQLEITPYPRGLLPLAGEQAYRLRVGDYRILYERQKDIILITRIDKRSRVYDR